MYQRRKWVYNSKKFGRHGKICHRCHIHGSVRSRQLLGCLSTKCHSITGSGMRCSATKPFINFTLHLHQTGNGGQNLFIHDPSSVTWTDLSGAVVNTPPIARNSLGFTSSGGLLYVFGGQTVFGSPGEEDAAGKRDV